MASDRRGGTPPRSAVFTALDEARFGPSRTLNLRSMLPTVAQATARTESWLREKQAGRAQEVLIITGRGNQSPGGVSVVRDATIRLFASLRRRGVVRSAREHTPGSFVVELAPLSAVREAPKRRRERADPIVARPGELGGLADETLTLLRQVAARALEALGVRDPAPFLEHEMLAQFAHVSRAVPSGPRREARLRAALMTLLDEYDVH